MLAFIEWTAKRLSARLCVARDCSVGCTVPSPTPTEDSHQLCLVRCETATSITVKIGRAVRLVVAFPRPQQAIRPRSTVAVSSRCLGLPRVLTERFLLSSARAFRSNELYRSAAQSIMILESHAALIKTPVVWSRLVFIWISSKISGKTILNTLPPGPRRNNPVFCLIMFW